MSSDIVGMLSFLCFISAVVFALILRRTKLTHIADYQVGLRFRDSASFRVLGPGSYRVFAERNPITVVDMRPHVFLLERLMFQDMMRANSVISVGGTVVVCDPQLALTTMKNVVDDSLAVVREGLLQTVTHSIMDASSVGRANLASNITIELNRELKTRGVEIRSLEVTELYAWASGPSISAEAN